MRKNQLKITTTILLILVSVCTGCSTTPSKQPSKTQNTDATKTSEDAGNNSSEAVSSEISDNENPSITYDEAVEILENHRSDLLENTDLPDLSAFPISKTFNYKDAESDYFNSEFTSSLCTPDYEPLGLLTSDIEDLDGNGLPELITFQAEKNVDATDSEENQTRYVVHCTIDPVSGDGTMRNGVSFYAPSDEQNGTFDGCLHANNQLYIDLVTDGTKKYISFIVGRTSVTNDRLFYNCSVYEYDSNDEYGLIPYLDMEYNYKDKTLTKRYWKDMVVDNTELLYKDSSSDITGNARYTSFEDAVSNTFKEYRLDYDYQLNRYNESSLIKHYATFKITAGNVKLEDDTATATFEYETEFYGQE